MDHAESWDRYSDEIANGDRDDDKLLDKAIDPNDDIVDIQML
jgi:hypothetical protein